MRLALALALPGTALAAETSAGVSVVGSIPERGVISARAVGQHLYVSALTGVSIYDVSDPRAPLRVGRLELPNAQNEDVDVGSGILLVSDDPIGGRGILHVIDVRDPTAPRLLSTYSTRVRFDSSRGGIGHTATCIQQCQYVWLAGSPAGIEVVDLRDPARPRRAGRFRARAAAGQMGTHDVQVDGWSGARTGRARVRRSTSSSTTTRSASAAAWWRSRRRPSAGDAGVRARSRHGGSRATAGCVRSTRSASSATARLGCCARRTTSTRGTG
jgi:hypothetical protein